MQPEPTRPTKPIVVPQRQSTPAAVDVRDTGSEQAANIVRSQIDALYNATNDTPQTTPPASDAETAANPYDRTHDEQVHTIEQPAWQRYHSAWQSYYQQYYERYYVGQVHQTKQALEAQAAVRESEPADEPLTRDEAMYDLRSKLLDTVQTKAAKVRKSGGR